jgi:type I restriction-modification system DNA methylase subunit
MINRQALLADLQKFLQRIEADLLERSESTEVPEVPAALHAEYEKAAKAERTAQNYEDWRTDTITQAAAAWVLSCVFVRFLEDNSIIDPPKIAGPGDRLARARDEQELYFRSHPQHTDREYLLSIFAELAKLPGTKDIFGEQNAINDLPNWLSGDAAGELLNFFQKINASTGVLVHDFTDPNWDTRFLGDLYQDLSAAARKKYALLQTPDFVEEFILDRTLEPALDEFGLMPQASATDQRSLTCFKMIDPACGSGHFLLGAFPRLLERWQRKEPSTNVRELAQRALDSIYGVDINPFAVAIARFRLLLAALRSCNTKQMDNSPNFKINVFSGDSLYHGKQRQAVLDDDWTDESHYFKSENLESLQATLRQGVYHVVVANPPYIIVQDSAANKAYRALYSTCSGKYALCVPFMQRIFELCIEGGYNGQITANSFMKRRFGKSLVEKFLSKCDVSHVIDTGGALIPGHATPTVIIFGRGRKPVSGTVRTVFGLRGEPSTPEVPRYGQVWQSILRNIDVPGESDSFTSSADTQRSVLNKHPWSVSGGGASELRARLDEAFKTKLVDLAGTMIGAVTLEDDAYVAPKESLLRRKIPARFIRPFCEGDEVRDWSVDIDFSALYPYVDGKPVWDDSFLEWCWPLRTSLCHRTWFRKSQIERGLMWHEYGLLSKDAASANQLLVFPEVASHNHFAATTISAVWKNSIHLVCPKSEDIQRHYYLLGILNSSVACFWLKQVSQQKQMTAGDGVRIESQAKVPYSFSATQLRQLPMPCPDENPAIAKTISDLAAEATNVAKEIVNDSPINLVDKIAREGGSFAALESERESRQRARKERLVALQENIDVLAYKLFGLTEIDIPSEFDGIANAGERPFEIKSKKNLDGFSVATGIPRTWPKAQQTQWELMLEEIEENPSIRLIEDPHYKRRWIGRQGKYNLDAKKDQLLSACTAWLLMRIESLFDIDGRLGGVHVHSNRIEVGLISVSAIADIVSSDESFMKIASRLKGDTAFDVAGLVEELARLDSVPLLPVCRFKESGLRKRGEWEKTWLIQRQEDKDNRIGTGSAPPYYEQKDYTSETGTRFWSLRGKLDVPKERWISFPHCEGPDGTLVICWAGYDHLQQAQAISAYYVRVQTEFGGSDDPRLIPLLASLIELLPWLKQWHNEPNANFDGLRMGDYFEGFVNEEARNLGKTLAEIKAWVPPKKVAKAAKPKKTKKSAAKPSPEGDE